MRSDKAAVERQRDALIEAYETQVIPVLTDVQREFVPATSRASEMLKTLQDQASKERLQLLSEIRSLRRDFTELKRQIGGQQ
jgi:Mg2+ and Co2+ transporter CorA